MDSAKIDELERLAAQATPGPWSCKSVPGLGGGRHNRPHIFADGVCLPVASLSVIKGEEDAAFIVAARNAVPDLIAENRALQERVVEYSIELTVLFGVKHDFEKRVRELERQNAGLEARIRYLTEERDALEWELNDIKRAIDD